MRRRLVDRGLPAALDDPVVVHVAGPVLGVPDPAGELQLDLGVRAERLVPDRALLRPRQVDAGQLDLAELGERQRQHDVVGAHERVAPPLAKVKVKVPLPRARSGHQSLAEAHRAPGSRRCSPVMSWSLPPWMCHFSSVPESSG